MAAISYPPEADPIAVPLIEDLDARVIVLEEGGGIITETDPVAGAALATHAGLTTGAHNLAALLGAKADASALSTEATTRGNADTALAGGLADHLADTTDAHDASAVSVVSPLTTGNAQAELERLSLAVGSSRLDLVPAPEAAVDLNDQKIVNLADPDDPQDAATRAYVLAHAGGNLNPLEDGAASVDDDSYVIDTSTGNVFVLDTSSFVGTRIVTIAAGSVEGQSLLVGVWEKTTIDFQSPGGVLDLAAEALSPQACAPGTLTVFEFVWSTWMGGWTLVDKSGEGTGGGLPSNIRTVTGATTAVANDCILANATSGVVPITLPTGAAGDAVIVVKTDASANAVTVAGTINGDEGGASITEKNWGHVYECTSPGAWRVVGVTASGADGADGATGPDGPTGPTGPAGLTWQGAWVSGTTYAVNDAVSDAGASYRRLIAGAGTTAPLGDATNWTVLAAKGATGLTGNTGDPGTAGANGILAIFKDEGSAVTPRDTLDVQGAGATLTQDGSKLILTVPGSSAQPNTPLPAGNGLKLWTNDPLNATSTLTPTAGVTYLNEMTVHDAETLATFWWNVVQTLGAGGSGAANLFFGLYALKVAGTLTLVGKTSDRVAAMSGVAAGAYNAPATAEAGETLALTGSWRVWAALLIGTQGSTTFQVRTPGGNPTYNLLGLTVGTDPLRFAKWSTGRSSLAASIPVSALTADVGFMMGAS
jgi:hypothetical protein